MLHGATANLTPTVLPPCKDSNPTASQYQHLLQLLRDCYMVLLQTLLLLYFHHAKLQILLLLSTNKLITTPKRLLHGATANLTPTVLPPCKASNPTASQNQHLLQLLRDCYMVLLQTLLLLYFHHAKLQILLLLRTNTYYNSQEIVTWCY